MLTVVAVRGRDAARIAWAWLTKPGEGVRELAPLMRAAAAVADLDANAVAPPLSPTWHGERGLGRLRMYFRYGERRWESADGAGNGDGNGSAGVPPPAADPLFAADTAHRWPVPLRASRPPSDA